MAQIDQRDSHLWNDRGCLHNVSFGPLRYLCEGQSMLTEPSLMVQTVFWQQMTVDLRVTTSDLNDAQSANLAGLALGCLCFIPFTVKYGRRPSYLISIAVLAASTWWMSRMETKPELIIIAIISGLAGSINETAVQMTVRQEALQSPPRPPCADMNFSSPTDCGPVLRPSARSRQRRLLWSCHDG